MKHELKSLPEFFQAAWIGDKTFEIRKDDRHFRERDEIVLQEYIPSEIPAQLGEYTGREIEGIIRYLSDYKQVFGYVVFAFEVTGKSE